MDKNDSTFQHLCSLFLGLRSAKLKEGIFVLQRFSSDKRSVEGQGL